jgi:hypothetical protein
MKVLGTLLITWFCGLAGIFLGHDVLFIPIPASLAPTTTFGCPTSGTVFTYNIVSSTTGLPNRMIAVEQDGYNCRIRSDAQGLYDWYGGLGPHFVNADPTERKMITELWPLRGDTIGTTSSTDPKKFRIEYSISYGLASVPAGLFWVYKVRNDYYWQDAPYYTRTLWWSPSLKWSIAQRMQDWTNSPDFVGYNWALLSVSSSSPGTFDRGRKESDDLTTP